VTAIKMRPEFVTDIFGPIY